MYHSVNCLDVRKATCEASPVTQSCLTLCNPMDCSLPGSSVPGIFQARLLNSIAISFSRRSSHPGIEPTSIALHVDSFLLSHLGNPHLK